MSTGWLDRLSAARRQHFVGRSRELGLFQYALTQPELPFNLLYVFGPGGVGKTTLLGEYASICEQKGARALYLDGRNLESSPESFFTALRLRLNLAPSEMPLQVLAAQAQTSVLMLDTYESLTPLDNWVRETLLPQMPENILLVLATREPPSAKWRADPAWQTLIRTIPLRNLSPLESQAYLQRRAVPDEQFRAVLDFTHGHPLALSLVADVFDQRPDMQFKPEETPDIVGALVEQFVQKVPGPAHRAALEACTLVRVTTEPLLAAMLAMPDPAAQGVRELFEWLRGLSFIQAGLGGLFPHDLARDTLAADLRWRNPDWYSELHRRARAYYTARFSQTTGLTQQATLFDLIYLHRANPMVKPFFEWQTGGASLIEPLREGDASAVLAMVGQYEGEQSAQLATHWLARQPHNVLTVRDTEKQVIGFALFVSLNQANANDLNADPGAQAVWRYLERHAPLRPGEVATCFRFWMARDTYQDVSPVQTFLFVNMVRHYLVTAGLAFTFLPCANPDFWTMGFAYANLQRLPEADFTVGGHTYGVYGHDWRAEPPVQWLALMGEREIATEIRLAPVTSQPIIVLSRDGFAAALHTALRDFSRPDVLRNNPLLCSRLVVDRAGMSAGADERVAILQNLIQSSAASLQQSPRDSKLYRALQTTYFQPTAVTQEQAAEQLDLPFSTYRRHLKSGEMRLVEMLWQREIGGIER